MQTFELSPTREEALRRLADFVPRAARDYAANRNDDRGSADRSNVSTLAPYIRCRLLTEEEVLRSVLARFTLANANKFVQEVFWRTYWKGWLESRPSVWDDYLQAVAGYSDARRSGSSLDIAYETATSGRTGIDAFDAWARELTETGYLHNHARMWFASIWIFTLKLPWELGADFFMRHLLCGDPASNTLSWRWVAGLHTRGKTYLARRDNIRRYTGGRFEVAEPLSAKAPALSGPPYPLEREPSVPSPAPASGPALLLLHDDDAGVDSLPLGSYDVRAAMALLATAGRAPDGVSPAVDAFARAALADALGRAPHGEPSAIVAATDREAAAAAIAERAKTAGTCVAVTGFAPVGPVRTALDALREPLERRGIALVELGRRYDALAWPHATRGYFGLRAKIPQILAALGITEPDD